MILRALLLDLCITPEETDLLANGGRVEAVTVCGSEGAAGVTGADLEVRAAGGGRRGAAEFAEDEEEDEEDDCSEGSRGEPEGIVGRLMTLMLAIVCPVSEEAP